MWRWAQQSVSLIQHEIKMDDWCRNDAQTLSPGVNQTPALPCLLLAAGSHQLWGPPLKCSAKTLQLLDTWLMKWRVFMYYRDSLSLFMPTFYKSMCTQDLCLLKICWLATPSKLPLPWWETVMIRFVEFVDNVWQLPWSDWCSRDSTPKVEISAIFYSSLHWSGPWRQNPHNPSGILQRERIPPNKFHLTCLYTGHVVSSL